MVSLSILKIAGVVLSLNKVQIQIFVCLSKLTFYYCLITRPALHRLEGNLDFNLGLHVKIEHKIEL